MQQIKPVSFIVKYVRSRSRQEMLTMTTIPHALLAATTILLTVALFTAALATAIKHSKTHRALEKVHVSATDITALSGRPVDRCATRD